MQSYGFLGADVSKGTSNFVLQNAEGRELEGNFQLDDNREGHLKLYELIKELKNKHGLNKVIVGVESTGGYENNWYKGLRTKTGKLGVEVYRINPKRIYHETRIQGRRSITDGVSAQVIAGYLRKNYGEKDLAAKPLQEEEDRYSSMKSLHKYIQRLVTQRTRTKNALEKLLYSTMPELLSLKGDKYSNWFLELLVRYPGREDILAADYEELTQIPYLGLAKANTIFAALEESVGCQGDEYMRTAISEQAQDIQGLNKKIDRLKNKLTALARKEKQMEQDIEIVTSINGIAEDTAIGCLMELGRVERFAKAKSLVAFWGINPTIKQSGDKTYYTGMSKDGSSSARAIMYMAARNVVMHEAYFATIYHQQRKKGKQHRAALGIVMSKLSRVIYGMLKNRKKFEASIDVENQEKIINKDSKKKSKANQEHKSQRRYQDKQSPAPVSMIQKVKRKQEQNVPS